MSIKIHHGANGSYKTSGAIQDDAIPALKAGRVIITNIRGFTLDSVMKVFPESPQSVEVINLSMEVLDDLEKLRTWFRWAPRGAFLIFDETQILFPKQWKEKDIDRFDFPGGPEAAKEADRPVSWLDAWTRHRHWNWDIVLTTPNIRYIRDDIRLTCEKAYIHANLALIGIKGRYKEAMHDAQENKASSDGNSIVTIKKIKKETFSLYESTATGIVTDTTAGKNLFLSPKVLGLLVFITLVAVYALSNGRPAVLGGSQPTKTGLDINKTGSQTIIQDSKKNHSLAGSNVGANKNPDGSPRLDNPLGGFSLAIVGGASGQVAGYPRRVALFSATSPESAVTYFTLHDLNILGYKVTFKTPCIAEISSKSGSQFVYCAGVILDAKK